ncbi:SDR family NAD(P)-dependent oxidoreductase [Haloplanus aerogenes]|uniref:NAD(P)-dependent dehydrogenase (Short-subunit alcohol dehydrogenase family) n=1 Tax=Haloplanus aerogenes TaxID=660522 RepID=A0A3M0DT53_9EURY|nr:SDR family NAD(P)-dependent oxidoreductase [Haloplanus aerogenes]AZH25473.1 SDR family oxidoreductase [Haloplanus aerogenes]RMB25185.1 NAD(P)-dependent dehydrogenase (short-subunit alcohol dehydrogenase family) [Haloplanus aerogenes]
MDLQDTRAVVTGGSRGIGEAICLELASRGVEIAIADIDEDGMADTVDRIETETDSTAEWYYVDLADPDLVDERTDEILDDLGGVEILVNNSGIMGPTAPLEDVTVEEWDQMMHVNLRGQFLMCRAMLPTMKDAGFGRIVNIASITGKAPLYNRAPYATSKMGVIGLTRTLADEVGEDGINVNAICPGSVEGPRIQRVFEKQAEARDVPYEQVEEEAKAESPIGQLVQPEDVAGVVAFLCTSDADRITGQDLNVSAGRVMY